MLYKSKKQSSSLIVASLFVSMFVGGAFGFLASLGITQDLKKDLKKELNSKSFITETKNNLEDSLKQERIIQNSEEKTVTEIIEQSNPAVVSIIISKDIPIIERYYADPFSGMEGFEDFFSPFSVPQERIMGSEKREIGGGTGFVVSEDGYIITNKHVVAMEDAEYTVLTNDERRFEVKILDRDPIYDIAILKIDPQKPIKGQKVEKLSFLSLGNSEYLKIGQTVIAIGNALGEFRNTVSKGIISGLRRNIVAGDGSGVLENLSELIQTDAAVNQGNSGGPLLNLNGEVIGVNVAMARGAENISFAIPINSIKTVIDSVKKQGRIVRPFLGVRYLQNNQEIAKSNNLPYEYGALVQRGRDSYSLAVIPGSPADKAGIRENDLILEIEGEKISEENPLVFVLSKYKVGDKLKMKIWSKGKEKTLEIKLEERKE